MRAPQILSRSLSIGASSACLVGIRLVSPYRPSRKVQPANSRRPGKPRQIEFVEYDLPNGLHVILHEDRSLPVVASYVLYHVGSKDERADRTGFAHFFEHLMFEGSDNIPRGKSTNSFPAPAAISMRRRRSIRPTTFSICRRTSSSSRSGSRASA